MALGQGRHVWNVSQLATCPDLNPVAALKQWDNERRDALTLRNERRRGAHKTIRMVAT